MDLRKFGETARGLAKNPLGIIALFIVLVYGIAGLVLGTTAKALSTDQKTVLVWFLFLFPFAVLTAFTWLVANHPKNLYGPSDYRSDEAYLQSLDAARQAQRLEEEVEEAAGEPSEVAAEQRAVVSPLRDEVMRRILLSEDLALREIEGEYRASVRRQVAVGDAELDAMFVSGGEAYGVEVKYVSGRLPLSSLLRQIESVAVATRQFHWTRFHLILALVVDGDPASIQSGLSQVRDFATRVGLDLEVRTYVLSELRQRYGA